MKEIMFRSSVANVVKNLESSVNEGYSLKVKRILNAISDAKKEKVMNGFSLAVVMSAVQKHRTSIILMLLNAASTQRKQELIRITLDEIIRIGGRNNESMFELLLRKANTELLKSAISSYFGFATGHGLVSTAQWLLQEAPDRKMELCTEHFSLVVFRWDIQMFELLLSVSTLNERQLMFNNESQSLSQCFKLEYLRGVSLLPWEIERKLKLVPLLKAYDTEDQRGLEKIVKCLPDIEQSAFLAKCVPAYMELIAEGCWRDLAGIVKMNAILQLVCQNISGKFTELFNVPFTMVCTFLGIPKFQQQPIVVIPALPCLKYVERFENEEKKPGGPSL